MQIKPEKKIIITGASRGIGAATALLAAQRGYAVVVNYHSNERAAKDVVAQIEEGGGKALAVQADISLAKDVARLFKEADHFFGRLDVLVNNAGILETQMRFEEMDAERLERIFRTNITGQLLCASEALKRMARRQGGNGGAIVNVSSLAAKTGSPNEYLDYAVSKGAIDTFTIGLAKEVAADGIRVNAVRPAFIETEIHAAGGEPGRIARLKDSIPLQRGGLATEVAEAILWLAGDQSSYSTGTFIDVTGGR